MPLMGSGGYCPAQVLPRTEPCWKAKLVWCCCTVAIVASVALAVVIFYLLNRSADAYPLVIYETDKPDVQLWQTLCEARDIKFTMAVFPLFYNWLIICSKISTIDSAPLRLKKGSNGLTCSRFLQARTSATIGSIRATFTPIPMPTVRRRIFFMTRSIGRFGNHSSIAYLGPVHRLFHKEE